jgi:hypothetical protein
MKMETNVPTKEYLMTKDRALTTVHCIKYREGSVMITDGIDDPMDVSKCEAFKSHTRLMKDIHYQYILYEHQGSKKLLLVPAFKSPELGTKHICILNRIPDGSKIFCSGEILRRDNNVQYATISSMYFFGIRPLLMKKVPRDKQKEAEIEYSEVTVKRYIEQVLPSHLKVYHVPAINFRLRKFNVEKMCKYNEDRRPKCLRYMYSKDCEIQQRNPNGPDCSVGEDVCSNIQKYREQDKLGLLVDDPVEILVPEDKYVYNKKYDERKAEIFAKKHNIKNSRADVLRYAKIVLKMSKEEYENEIFSDKRVWP